MIEKEKIILKNGSNTLTSLSPHLFWDVDVTSFNGTDHKSFIIKRVLEYGLWPDFLCIKKYYGLDEITKQSQAFRNFDPKALAFISQLSGVPKTKFRCYDTKQLTPQHWNF
jgi:hypothetical protein